MPDYTEIPDLVLGVLEEAGPEVVSYIQDLLDVDYPPSSKTGESPRRRSGDLLAGISYLVFRDGDEIVLQLASEMPYSQYLEPKHDGAVGANLNRPFLSTGLDEFGPVIFQRLKDLFGGPPPVVSAAGAIVPVYTVAA